MPNRSLHVSLFWCSTDPDIQVTTEEIKNIKRLLPNGPGDVFKVSRIKYTIDKTESDYDFIHAVRDVCLISQNSRNRVLSHSWKLILQCIFRIAMECIYTSASPKMRYWLQHIQKDFMMIVRNQCVSSSLYFSDLNTCDTWISIYRMNVADFDAKTGTELVRNKMERIDEGLIVMYLDNNYYRDITWAILSNVYHSSKMKTKMKTKIEQLGILRWHK